MPPPASRIFAACAPGLEPVLAAELGRLGLDARAAPGGAEALGEDAVALACLGSRVADAVLLRLFEGPEADLDRALREARRRHGDGAPLRIRRERGRATVSIDAVGEPLYKRGLRARIGAAPLRETLAAGMLLHCGYDGESPFLDPMCGSGTVAIEAALIATRRAPGVSRRFAFEAWPGHDGARTAALRARLAAAERPAPAPIHASDRNGGAARIAQKNAAAAGLQGVIRLERADAATVVPPARAGLCCTNPPYGVRLDEDAPGAWRALAKLLPRLAGWTLCVITADRGLEKLLGRPPGDAVAVSNGGLACKLLRFAL